MRKTSRQKFFANLGLRRPLSEERFVDRLSRQYGKLGDQIIDQINERASGNLTDDFYEAKNSNKGLSLLLSSQFNWDFYHHYLSWFDDSITSEKITSLLDVGCDNGILTCYYAYRFPDAAVVGIDRCSNAISVAKMLANRLNLKNVSFEQCDIVDTQKILTSKRFSVITATMVFSSAYRIPSFPDPLDSSKMSQTGSSDCIAALQMLKSLMSATASIITVERLTSPAAYYWWSKVLSDAQLAIRWERNAILLFKDKTRIPIFVADNQLGDAPSFNDALSFHARPELEQLAKNPLQGYAAEALFKAFSPRELVWGIECHLEQIRDRLEVWKSETIILAYESSNRVVNEEQVRRLVIAPIHSLDNCITSVRSTWKARPYERIHEYQSLEERKVGSP